MTKHTEVGWNFDHSYAELPDTFYSSILPTPVSEPELVLFNKKLAQSLGLDTEQLEKEGAAIFAGNETPEGAAPLAQAYTGHQFGNFTMLGDGRAILLGEQITPAKKRVDIQLKGAGRTPYSRGGDGRSALGPMLREYVISEAMHALGIPTTRGLAVVTTGEQVIRDEFLPGAILTRVASSHLRVGTFQYAASSQKVENVRTLADYAIDRHYPEVQSAKNKYRAFLQEVVKKQAQLIAKWQLVGFIHGVMNTDNMTISGETIDYGPCAFMDTYHTKTVFSSIDRQGRYSYENQPAIGGWNLARFAETLLPLLHQDQDEAVKLAQEDISHFGDLYEQHWLAGMRAKLGLAKEEEVDESLVNQLLSMMQKYKADYTNTFLALTFDKFEDEAIFQSEEFNEWYELWQRRLEQEGSSKEEAHRLMKSSNPALIPRNHRVEEALTAAVEEDDYTVLHNLLAALANPYAHTADQAKYATLPEPTLLPYKTFCGT